MKKLLTSALALTVSATLLHAANVDISGEYRVRGEANKNLVANTVVSDSTTTRYQAGSAYDTRALSRLRINLDANASADTSVHATVQDARVLGDTTSTDSLDLFEAYINHNIDARHSVKIGRQTMSFGKGRLIGNPDFSNTGTNFDGIRATGKLTSNNTLDAFWARLSESSPAGDNGDNTLYGLYSTNKSSIVDFDVYYIDRQLLSVDDQNNLQTFGLRLEKNIQKFTLEGEYTFETGVVRNVNSVETKYDANAYAFNAYYAVGNSLNTMLKVGYSSASGDDAGTADNEQFRPIAISQHDFNGIGDIFRGTNLTDITVGVKSDLAMGVSGGLCYHKFDKVEAATGQSKDLGSEIDVVLNRSFGSLETQAGAAYYLAGEGVNNTTDPADAAFAYLSFTTKF